MPTTPPFTRRSVTPDDVGALLDYAAAQAVQQRDIGVQIQQLKIDGAAPAYPLPKERELVHAITEGDQPTARRAFDLRRERDKRAGRRAGAALPPERRR